MGSSDHRQTDQCDQQRVNEPKEQRRAAEEQQGQAGGAAAPNAAAEPPVAEQEQERAATERQVEHDIDELITKAAQRDEYLSLAQRTQADFENYRKRTSKELAAAEVRGVSKLTLELLPAMDNLDRALAHLREEESSQQQLVEGIRLVQTELAAALERAGLDSYYPEGEPFDPTFHEAMVQRPVAGFASGTVVEVYQRGYRIGDLVIRPARVVVAE